MSIPVTPAELLVAPGEDLEAFEDLRAALHAEYQAATPTELLLVEELVQNAWRIRRFRKLEVSAFKADNSDLVIGLPLLALAQRSLVAAERAYHRALTALTKLRRARQQPQALAPPAGFVSQKTPTPPHAHDETLDFTEPWNPPPDAPFVSQKHRQSPDFVLQKSRQPATPLPNPETSKQSMGA